MSTPRYGLIKNMPGARRVLRIEGDTVHFEEEGVASRAVHRSRVTFLKDKPLPRPKWEQGELFGKNAFGINKAQSLSLRRLVKDITGQAVGTGYSKSKKAGQKKRRRR